MISPARLYTVVFAVSFVAIGWQLALMRCLLISRYQHFSFLVISGALLGFGMGGTALSLWKQPFERNSVAVFRWGTIALGVSLPVCFALGEVIPLNVHFPPMLLYETLGMWALFWLCHLVPFFLCGTLIGLALMQAGDKVHRVYAVNLTGSAAGALGTQAMMWVVPANGLLLPLCALVLLSALALPPERRTAKRSVFAVVILLLLGGLTTIALIGVNRVLPLRIDQYKSLAYVQRLEQQGAAEQLRELEGPRGRVELYRSPHFHTLLSLGTQETPSMMDLVLKNGFRAGAIPRAEDPEDLGFLKQTLSYLPYRLGPTRRVLILGAGGAVHLQAARLTEAREIVWVQPDPNIVEVVRDHPSGVLNDPRIRVVETEPRAFLDSHPEPFDVIQLAGLEAFAAGSSGIGGGRRNYLATVEGFTLCLEALTDKGRVIVVRGIQDPPRDNIRLIGTWVAALERIAVAGRIVRFFRKNCGGLFFRQKTALPTSRKKHSCLIDTTKHESPCLRPALRDFVSETGVKSAQCACPPEGRGISPPDLPISRGNVGCFSRGLSWEFQVFGTPLLCDSAVCIVTDGFLGVRNISQSVGISDTWNMAADNPGRRLLIARDELSVAVTAFRNPVSENHIDRFKEICRDMSWETEWFPGITPEQTNVRHVLPGPDGESYSWYHHAILKILSPEREAFYRNWMCHVAPATDDRPFFSDYFKWESVEKLRRVFGPMWPARSEMGFLVVVAAVVWTASLALVFLVIPALVVRARSSAEEGRRVRLVVLTVYFVALGTAFMFLEMTFIGMFTRFLGDPIAAAALIVGGFLLFAGFGSVLQPRVTGVVPGGIVGVTILIGILAIVLAEALPVLFREAANLSLVAKVPIGLIAIAPLTFLMGTPFPWALGRLQETEKRAVPLAWAVNGFASVVATCLAVVFAMSWGSTLLIRLAALLYVVAGLVSRFQTAGDG